MTGADDPAGADAAEYRLGDGENRRIFLDSIVPEQMAGRAPQHTPVVVFLVGQPGAGKSRVGAALADRLNQRGGFVDIDSDLYKPYHPAYDDLMAHDDRLMAAFTRAASRHGGAASSSRTGGRRSSSPAISRRRPGAALPVRRPAV